MTRSDRPFRPLRGVLLVVLLALCAGPARADLVYPRLGLYGSVRGGGTPFVDSTGALVPSALDQVARYDEVVLEVSPITEYRPDVLAALRARNPNLKALAFVLGHNIWDAYAADSLVHYPTRYRRLVQNLGGYLYNTAGDYFSISRVNIAKRDAYGHFVVAEGLADLFYDAIVRTGLWDGIFVDVFCDNIEWAQSPSESIDVVRAGYPDHPSFDLAWKAATDTLASRLRRRCPPGYILVGNCGTGTKYGVFNGWMRENFPYQDGGTWYANMLAVPGGYVSDEASFRAPTHDYIFSMVQGIYNYSAYNARKVRFGLGSASLGTGFGVFGPGDRNLLTAPYHTWWYAEYAVDLSTGRSSDRREHTGWLGTARGPWYQMIWVGNGTDVVSNPGFESNVTDGWWFSYHPAVPTTVTRDSTTAAVGRSSARIHFGAEGPYDWFSTFGTSGTIYLQAGREYSATFWARASGPRRLMIYTYVPGSDYTTAYQTLDTAWRQYQVTLVPFVTGTAELRITFSREAGDIWLDDVHFQAGSTNLYRRDFQNGIVLVNPSQVPLTVPLGKACRRIRGAVDPVTNDGSTVTEAVVPASDALFLIDRGSLLPPDLVRPAAPGDLRIQR